MKELGTMSKGHERRITLVRGPIWGIHSLTLIISCFDIIQKLVPGKDHFNNKKHYKCTNVNLKQKITGFLNFPKPMRQKLVAMAT